VNLEARSTLIAVDKTLNPKNLVASRSRMGRVSS